MTMVALWEKLLSVLAWGGLLLFAGVALVVMAAQYLDSPPPFVQTPAFRDAAGMGYISAISGIAGLLVLMTCRWVAAQSRDASGRLRPGRLLLYGMVPVLALTVFVITLYVFDHLTLFWQHFK